METMEEKNHTAADPVSDGLPKMPAPLWKDGKGMLICITDDWSNYAADLRRLLGERARQVRDIMAGMADAADLWEVRDYEVGPLEMVSLVVEALTAERAKVAELREQVRRLIKDRIEEVNRQCSVARADAREARAQVVRLESEREGWKESELQMAGKVAELEAQRESATASPDTSHWCKCDIIQQAHPIGPNCPTDHPLPLRG